MNWETVANALHDLKWTLAGCFGALVASWLHRDELASKTDFAMFFVSGWGCAYFLTGLVAQQFAIDTEHVGAVGFLLGAFGGSLISAVVRGIRSADLWAFVKQRFGGGE